MSQNAESAAVLPNPGLSSLRDLNDLEVFARVVARAGFSRAAKELGVPPSTVSRRISRLEESLGVRLLQRTTRTIHLTDAGRVYYERISHALREIESAEVSLRNVQGTPRGRVRVSTVAEPFIESIVFDFLERYPEVSIDLDKSHRRVDLVAEGFDLAVRAGALPDSSLVAHKLASSGSRLVASPDYLARRGVPKCLTDLRDHDAVVLGATSSAATWQLGGPKGPERVAVSGRFAVNSFQAAVEGVRRGLGIGLLSGYVVEVDLRQGILCEVLPEFAPPPVDLWVIYPSRALLPPAVRLLIEAIRAAFRDSQPLVPREPSPGFLGLGSASPFGSSDADGESGAAERTESEPTEAESGESA
ncbi:MAG TPA: LysR family transcriptional regulator [Polyangiaceae bacterium]|nr:LysR family transcriptional regulator [Polyangiaceae bacterium]